MFSIIVPTLNEEKYLPVLLENLKNQTYRDFEVIVVDAESTDDTVDAAGKFKDYFPLKVISSEIKNPGVQRNLGAKTAKHEWLIFIDADSQLNPDLLEKLNLKITKNKIDFFSTYTRPYPAKLSYQILLTLGSLYLSLMQRSGKPFVTEGFFGCNRKAFMDIGGFNPKIKVNEGNDLLETAFKKGYRFKIFSDIYFTQHMRRLEKNGFISSCVRFVQILMAHVFNKPLPAEKLAELYPMDDRFR